MTPELLNPIAIDDGRIIRPFEAEKGGSYGCPACSGTLYKRGGDKTTVREHFAHHSEGGCQGESDIHKAAKQVVFHNPNIALRPVIDCGGRFGIPCGRRVEVPFADAVPHLEHRAWGLVYDVGFVEPGRVDTRASSSRSTTSTR